MISAAVASLITSTLCTRSCAGLQRRYTEGCCCKMHVLYMQAHGRSRSCLHKGRAWDDGWVCGCTQREGKQGAVDGCALWDGCKIRMHQGLKEGMRA